MNKIMGFNDWSAGSSPKTSKVEEEEGGVKADEGNFLETVKEFLKNPKGKASSKLKKANVFLNDLSRKRKKKEHKETEKARIDKLIKELESFISDLKKPKKAKPADTSDVSMGSMPILTVDTQENEEQLNSDSSKYNENQIIAMKVWIHDNCHHPKIKNNILLSGGINDGSHTNLLDEIISMCVNKGYVNSEEHLLNLALDEEQRRKERSEYIPNFRNNI